MIRILSKKARQVLANKNLNEVIHGSFWALGSRLIATGLGLVVSIVVARNYGANMLGTIALINSLFMVATIFTLAGTNTSIMRLIPEHRVKYSPTSALFVYRKSQLIVILFSLLLGLLIYFTSEFVATNVFSKPHLAYFFSLLAFFLLFKTMVMYNTQAVRGAKLVKGFAIMQVAPQFLNLCILYFSGFIYFTPNAPVYSLFASLAITGFLGYLLVEWCFYGARSQQDNVRVVTYHELLVISLPMFMTGVVSVISGQFGLLMLGVFGDEADVGVYSAAVKLATLTGFMLRAINSVIAPKIAELYHKNELDELFLVVKKTSKIIFISTVPVLLVLLLFGQLLLSWLFGDEFSAAYPALMLLVCGQFVNSVTGCTGMFMNMTGSQVQYRNIIVVGAIIFMLLNAFLIPKYGFIGAAFSVLIAELIWNLSSLLYIKIKHKKSTGYLPFVG
ncbi:MAG: flippase [Pseudomonadales bacterium]|nr:flippase [Pseudomonadales bacterium]